MKYIDGIIGLIVRPIVQYVGPNRPVVSSTPTPTPTTSKNAFPLDFDYAVVTYSWGANNGSDLDIRTDITTPARNVDVGWSRNAQDEDYLIWGGDNQNPYGTETMLVDFKSISGDYSQLTQIMLNLKAFWYGIRTDGNITLNFVTYKGGFMERSGTTFVNKGGYEVDRKTVVTNAISNQSLDLDGDLLARLRFDVATQIGEFIVDAPAVSSTPTPTPTVTPTKTVTPTVTPTITLTPSVTPTRGASPTPTPSVTPTISVTPTVTPTISVTPSVTPTISVTPSVTVSPSLTRTPTPTPTTGATLTPTPTVSVTISFTPTPTPVPSRSGAFTPTPTRSATPTPTPTRSATPGPSVTPSTSITPSVTPTISLTPSVTASPSLTPSVTPTISLTPSVTPTLTPSITVSPSLTPQPSKTATPTPTPSVTPTMTPTISITPTISVTPTATVTPTPSPTMTPTISVTPSVTRSPTPTPSPTVTPTISAAIPSALTWTAQAAPEAGTNQYGGIAYSSSLNKTVIVSRSALRSMSSTNDAVSFSNPVTTAQAVYRCIWVPAISKFVAMGKYTQMSSADGTTWSGGTTHALVNNATWNDLIYVPSSSLIVAIGENDVASPNRVMTSPDGVTWTPRSIGANTAMYALAYSPSLNRVVGLGQSRLVYSNDGGVSWNLGSITSGTWKAVAWSPTLSRFVAVAAGVTSNFATSTDGLTWNVQTLSSFNSTEPSIIWIGDDINAFVAINNAGTTGMISADGLSWVPITQPLGDFRQVTYNPNTKTLMAAGINTSTVQIMTGKKV